MASRVLGICRRSLCCGDRISDNGFVKRREARALGDKSLIVLLSANKADTGNSEQGSSNP